MKESCFSRPCCDLVTPLLVELADRYPCQQWEAACKLVHISRCWHAVVAEWCGLLTDIVLDERVDKATLLTIAAACKRLRRLTLRSSHIPQKDMSEGLTAIATRNDLIALNLIHCKNISFYDSLRAGRCASIQVLNLTGLVVSDRDLVLIMGRIKQLETLVLEDCLLSTSWCALALLVEETGKTLKVLNLSAPATTSITTLNTWPLFSVQLAECQALQELFVRGLPLLDSELSTILGACERTLKVLDLSETLITKDSLIRLAALPALERLCVQGWVKTMDENLLVAEIWPRLGKKLRGGWAYLDFFRARPDDPAVKWYGPSQDPRTSIPIQGLNFTVGRSRSNDLRIGDNWTNQLYVSSEHMVVYPWFVWDRSKSPKEPTIEPWVLDKSQNGTFLNKEAVGYMQRAPLQDGVRLEVFSRRFFPIQKSMDIDIPACHFRGL